MSFKEDLGEALEKAVSYYNGGCDPNEAIVKSAQEMKFNLDQTDRLVEKFNTARTINYFERNPDDRTGSFDIASKEKVAEYLFSDRSEKKASAGHGDAGWHDYSQYDSKERDYFSPSLEKSASSAAADDRFARDPEGRHEVGGYSTASLCRLVIKRASDHGAQAREIRDRIGMISSEITSELSKIASSVASGYDPGSRYAVFKAACGGEKAFPHLEGLVPAHVRKSAESLGREIGRSNVVDLGDMETMAEGLRKISEVMSGVEEFEREAERHEEYRRNILSRLEKVAAGKGGGKGSGDDDEYSAAREFLNLGSDMVGKPVGNVGSALTGVSNLIGGKGLSEYIDTGFLGSRDEIQNAVSGGKRKKDKSLAEHINNLRRSTILQDLYENDPILQEADPNALADAYSTIVQTSPEMSLNKELVRAVLRQSVNSMAVSPFDAKQWADLDNVMKKNRGELKQDNQQR